MIKVLRSILLVCLLLIFVLPNLKATSLIGTSSIVYENSLYTFEDGDQARGFICLNGGFEVPVDGGVRLSLNMPVRNLMALNTTGSVILESNLTLDPGVVLDSGGIVNGGGYTLILSGDLTIPALTTLKTTSTLTIDGKGHTLFIDNFGQLLVDSHSTLTLKNIVIKNDFNSSAYPAIALNNADSKLALDNVKMAFSNDFWINTGEVFFHNKVKYTGNTALVYHSPQTSFIAPNSSLQFDKNTSFFYLPQNTESNILQMQDDTADLFLDGCSVESTPTGLTLSRGRVFFDNRVALNVGKSYIAALDHMQTISYGSDVISVAWSADGAYLAMGGRNQNNYESGVDVYFKIYKFDPADSMPFTLMASQYYASRSDGMINAVCWSPDGNYVAFGGYGAKSSGIFTTQTLRVYQFLRDSNTLQPICGAFYGTTINAIDWSNSGNYIAVAGSGATATDGFSDTYNVKVYLFDSVKKTLSAAASYPFTTYDVRTLHWRFSEDYLAIGGAPDNNDSNTIQICKFDPLQLEFQNRLTQVYRLTPLVTVLTSRWSHDGQYLAVGGFNDRLPNSVTGQYEQIQVFAFDPSLTSSLTYLSGYPLLYRAQESVFSVDWNNDDSLISVGSQVNSGYKESLVSIFNFDPTADGPDLILNKISVIYGTVGQASSTAWHPSGLFIAYGSRMGAYAPVQNLGGYLALFRYKGRQQQIVDSKFYSDSSVEQGGVSFASWTTDGKYLAVSGQNPAAVGGFNNTDNVRIYKFDDNTELLLPVTSIQTSSSNLTSMEFSPDGKYLLVSYGKTIAIYRFNSSMLQFVTSKYYFMYASVMNKAVWHPNGKLIAICNNGTSINDDWNVALCSFDGHSLSGIFGEKWVGSTPNNVYAIDWSSNGRYLGVLSESTPFSEGAVLKLNTNNNAFSAIAYTGVLGAYAPKYVQWGCDDKIIVFADAHAGRFYYFSGTALMFRFNFRTLYAGWNQFSFSPDGASFASIGTSTNNYVDNYYLSSISLDQLTYSELLGTMLRGDPMCLSWQSSGQYLAIGLNNALVGCPDLYIVKVNKLADLSQNAPKGMDLDYSLKTQILGGAQVDVNGVVNYSA